MGNYYLLKQQNNMKQLVIKATHFTPRVELNPEGGILIEGRSIIEDQSKFYLPILRWIKSCTFSALSVDIKIEHMNSNCAKEIFSILTLIRENYSIKTAHINWFYEEGDNDTLELGKEFESRIDLPFDFYKFYEVTA